jgi:uncharacterized membrane protein
MAGISDKNRESGFAGGLARRARLILALGAVLLVGLAATADSSAPARPLAQAMATKNHDPFPLVAGDAQHEVRFALSEFADGAAHFFTFMADASPVELFVIWTPDGVVRAALNACDVCYRAKLGYRQDGNVMVCQNCGNRFPVGQIGAVSGGCNPTPLAAHIDGEELVIYAADLAAATAYFK